VIYASIALFTRRGRWHQLPPAFPRLPGIIPVVLSATISDRRTALAVSSDRVVPALVFRYIHTVARTNIPSKKHPLSRRLGTWLYNSDN